LKTESSILITLVRENSNGKIWVRHFFVIKIRLDVKPLSNYFLDDTDTDHTNRLTQFGDIENDEEEDGVTESWRLEKAERDKWIEGPSFHNFLKGKSFLIIAYRVVE